MLKISLTVIAIIIGVANGFRYRLSQPQKNTLGIVAESVLPFVPVVVVASIVGICIIAVMTYVNRREQPSGDEMYQSFAQLEKQVASLLEEQTTFKKKAESGRKESATQRVKEMLKMEGVLHHRQQHAEIAYWDQAYQKGQVVDEIAKTVEEQARGEGVRDKDLITEVQELLNEWEHYRNSRVWDKEPTDDYLINQLTKRPGQTCFPKDLHLSLLPAEAPNKLNTI